MVKQSRQTKISFTEVQTQTNLTALLAVIIKNSFPIIPFLPFVPTNNTCSGSKRNVSQNQGRYIFLDFLLVQ